MEVEDSEDLHLIAVHVAGHGQVQTAGISESGIVYIRGDIHPLGSQKALALASVMHVPYVAVSAVEVLFPSDWLRAECLHDADRLRVIGEAEAFVRGARV